jgi:hypothetical protein
MKNIVVTIILSMTGAMLASSLFAQDLDTFDLYDNGRPLPSIYGFTTQDNEELADLRFKEEIFPLIVLPRNQIVQVVKIFNQKDTFQTELENQVRHLAYQDTVSSLEIIKLKQLVGLHQQQLILCDSTNTRLNRSIVSLNSHLAQVGQIAKDCNDARVGKSTGAALLGGGIGIGIGLLIGILAN